MKLIAYVADGYELEIRPARPERDWMDKFVERQAYGCLPMAMANMHGWEILSPVAFTAIWNGGAKQDCLAVLEDGAPSGQVVSHFGSGIITFKLAAVFCTEEGFDLYVQGPPNAPVDGAVPLAGIVETDWIWTTISMNWKLTQPTKAVRFRKNQPICQIFPIRRGELENFQPEKRNLSDEPALAKYMKEWSDLRREFNEALKDPSSQERKMKWPGDYRRGVDLHGKKVAPETHRNRLRLKAFTDQRDKAKGEPVN
jgi:hypothetical protein